MKKLKTIIAVLVLTLALLGCEKNNDLYEFEGLMETENSKSYLRSPSQTMSTVSIKVIYSNDQYLEQLQNHLRDYYTQYFEFFEYSVCVEGNGVILEETWTIGYVTQREFDYILSLIELPVFDPPPTGANGKGDDGDAPSDPIGIVFGISFEYQQGC